MIAAISPKNTPEEKKAIFRSLGVKYRRRDLSKLIESNADMADGRFTLPKRKTRNIDATRIIKMVVKAFSRDDDSSWDDPNLKIRVIEDGIPLCAKVWILPQWDMRRDAFNASPYLQQIRDETNNPNFLITKQYLKKNVCRSVREGSHESCSDHTVSGMILMLKALRKAAVRYQQAFQTPEQKAIYETIKKITSKLCDSFIAHCLCLWNICARRMSLLSNQTFPLRHHLRGRKLLLGRWKIIVRLRLRGCDTPLAL